MFQVIFYVDDKNLGEAFKRLAGIARNVQHVYVPNVESKANGKTYMKAADAVELLAKEIHKTHKDTVLGPEIKKLLSKVGMNTSSYHHYIDELIKAGFLRKGKKSKNSMQYIVTEK